MTTAGLFEKRTYNKIEYGKPADLNQKGTTTMGRPRIHPQPWERTPPPETSGKQNEALLRFDLPYRRAVGYELIEIAIRALLYKLVEKGLIAGIGNADKKTKYAAYRITPLGVVTLEKLEHDKVIKRKDYGKVRGEGSKKADRKAAVEAANKRADAKARAAAKGKAAAKEKARPTPKGRKNAVESASKKQTAAKAKTKADNKAKAKTATKAKQKARGKSK